MAVGTSHGPHLTPELFTISGDRIVCMSAASTLKVRRAASSPTVGMAARSAAGSFSATAHVEVVDPASPTTALRSPAAAASLPLDMARFVRDNAAELTGAAVDAVAGRLGLPPQRRVALVFSIAAATIDDGDQTSVGWESLGDLSVDDEGDDETLDVPAEGELDLDDVPARLRSLMASTEVMLGWERSDGTPLALPGRWDDGAVIVSSALLEAVGAANASPACATFDDWTGFGPSGKRGIMLRGHGRAASQGATTRVQLDIDRATHWEGVDTGTVTSDPPS